MNRVTVTLWISELTDFVIASVFSIFFWSLITSAWFLSYWVVSFCLLSLCLEYPLISFSTSLIFFSSSSIYRIIIKIILFSLTSFIHLLPHHFWCLLININHHFPFLYSKIDRSISPDHLFLLLFELFKT